MEIRIFVTGGTFDKEYDMINGKLFFDNTHLPEIFELGRSKVDSNIRTLMMIDSLEMTDEDRQIIALNCRKAEENNILITHGTDTMTKTAAYLAKQNIDKTIVLTGALIPYKFGSSDGLFNLGSAIAFTQCLQNGVYISMHGKYFNWNNVIKNRDTGFFEEINK